MNDVKPTVLFVDDEPMVLTTLERHARTAGFVVTTAASGNSAILKSRERPPDIAMVDVRLPGMTGFDVLRAIRQNAPACQVVLMTGHASVEMAVQALKFGACDYLGKPLDFARIDSLLAHVKSVFEQRESEARTRDHKLREDFGMVGEGPAIRHLIGAIRRLAPYVRTALVIGETGTGKELVARALHRAGRRANKPFVTINCSAVVETLFESELFGHVRGAFTGAHEHKVGLFEAADQGVLFLDEVGELPLGVQAKLLRVLELGEIQRVGSLDTRRVDVQVIAATNRDLCVEVAAGRFRRDLYYRLNIIELRTPPLRERREDIRPLTHAFMRECCSRWNKPLTAFAPEALDLLVQAPWDGNVRELRNVVERACLLADGPQISEHEVASSMPGPSPESPLQESAAVPPPFGSAVGDEDVSSLRTVERHHIMRALEHARGNKKAAARMLGVSRRALYRRLDRLGLESTIARRPTPAAPQDGQDASLTSGSE